MFRRTALIALFALFTTVVDAQWTNIGGAPTLDLAADASTVYIVKRDDNRVYRYNGSGFRQLPGGIKAVKIAASSRGIYVIGADRAVYRHTGSSWVRLGGNVGAQDIAVDGRGHVYVVGRDYKVYFHSRNDWAKLSNSINARALGASESGHLFAIGTNTRLYRRSGSGFTMVGQGSYVDVAADRLSRAVVSQQGGKIGLMNGSVFSEFPGRGRGREVAVSTSGTVYVKGGGGNVYRQSTSTGTDNTGSGNGSTVNRPPYVPTTLGPKNNTKINRGTTTLRWRNNGDPERDRVYFWLMLSRWDGRKWVNVYSGYVNGNTYRFQSRAGTHYAWRVYATDKKPRRNRWTQVTRWERFSTR